MPVYDVAVIGAGPAGATLARLIADRWRVLLVDKRPLEPAARQGLPTKCCGGLLAPDAQKMLGVLGLGLPLHVLEEPQVFLVRAIDLRRQAERCYQRHYINVDREAFDCWLASQVPPAVDVRFRCRLVSCEAEGGEFRMSFLQDGRGYSERARVVIGADGAGSSIRRLLVGRRIRPKVYLAIQEWFEAHDPLPYFSAVFDPDITDYYSWTIPKRKALLLGSALLPGQGCRARFDLLKTKLADFGFQLGRPVQRETGLLLRPSGPRHVCTGGNGIGLIGEAAGWISPSSAEGLSYAFRSAIAMAEALREGLEGFLKRYARGTRALARNILLKGLKSRFIHGGWLRGVIMRSGVRSLKVVGR
jgi:flavin-dependent dehydrogenase